MNAVVLFCVLIYGATGSPAYQSVTLGEDGSYQFFYETGKDAGNQWREESRGSDGVVIGRYSYEDPSGDLRVVNYRADDQGYVAKGDVGVPGAPQAQVPPEDGHKHDDEDQNITSSTQSTEITDENRASSSTEPPETNYDEDYEDDVKATKLQEPSYDGQPDGFPMGFFGQGFQGLRRLPEPSTTDTKTTDSKTTGAKTTGIKDAETTKKDIESVKKDHSSHDSPNSQFQHYHPFYHFNPNSGAEPVSYISEGQHTPFIYSYQQPDGYGYYYAY